MSTLNEPDLPHDAHPDVLAAIDELLSVHPGLSVHYVGHAREAVLRLLHQHLGTAFSVMDLADRYHTGASFFWEGPGPFPGPHRPVWLEGVPFYQEGAPDVDMLIRDAPMSHSTDQFFGLFRRPDYLLLIGDACAATLHPDYSWTVHPTHALGLLACDGT